MKKALSIAALAAAAAALAVPPAGAAVGDCRELMSFDDPPVPTGVTVCRQDAWFHAAQQRLSNLPNSGTPSWNTTKPTAAFQSGGAIYAALRPIDMLQSSPQARPTFTGTYTGVLDNLAVSAFTTSLYSATGGSNALFTKLSIDGKVAWENAAAADPEVAVPNEKVDDQTARMSFAFTNLAARLKTLKLANTPTTAHTITVSFINKYWGDSNFVVRYDATEYPAGLIFNLEPDPDFGGLPGYAEISTDA
jgi:hypothetical protein